MISKTIEQEGDNAKADHLREEMRLIQAEFFGGCSGSLRKIAAEAGENSKLIHAFRGQARSRFGSAPEEF